MGTLGQKLDYLDNTKSILKQKINNLGGSLTDQSTFRSYGDYLDELYNEMPKVTGEGTEITLTPTRKGRMQLDLKGNTSQATQILPEGYTQLDYIESTGTQYIDTGRFSTPNTKFEMDYISTKQPGDTFQCLFGSQNGTQTNRVYILFGTPNNIQTQFPHNSNAPLYMQNNGTFSKTQQSSDVIIDYQVRNKYIFDLPNRSLTIGEYTSVSVSTYEILPSNHNILILARNDNTTPTSNFATGKLYRFKWYENNVLTMDFVPCKNTNNVVGLYDLVSQTFFGNAGTGDFIAGNEVSIPNPDYPQDIHVVTGNNTIGVQGRNLFDENILKQETNYNTYDSTTQLWTTNNSGSYGRSILYNATGYASRDINKLVPLTSAGTYTLKLYDFVNNTSYASALELALFDNEGSKISQTTQSSNFIKFTIDRPCYMDLCRRNNSGTISFSKVMLVQGDYIEQTLPDYVPYVEPQKYPINLGSLELCKIGDYQDYFYKENGNWYKYGAINKLALTENTNIFSVPYGVNSYGLFVPSNSYMRTISDKIIVISNKYKGIAYDDRINEISNSIYEADRQDMIHFRNTQFETVEDFITNNIGTILYVVLKTPTITQITDETLISQLDAIENAMSTTDTTTISQTNADLPFIITASALKPFTTETLTTSLTDGE